MTNPPFRPASSTPLYGWILLLVLSWPSLARSLKVVTKPLSYEYHVEDDSGRVLFTGGDIAVFVSGKWCVHQQQQDREEHQDHWTLTPQERHGVRGTDPILGAFVGETMTWSCPLDAGEAVPIQTHYKNFECASAVVFEVEWPRGARNTTVVGSSHHTAMTNYPALQVHLPNALSWQGSFAQSLPAMSMGTQGGPTVFYNGSDPNLGTVVVGSPWNFVWKSFSAGDQRSWRSRDPTVHWTPGTSGRIAQLPAGHRQAILLYQRPHGRGGITGTVDSWGQVMRRAGRGFPKQPDVTLEKIGYQTDNGAMYCFCNDQNCSQTLLQEVESLKFQGVPMGYLSFQGSGASSGRGKAAPWCVETWGVDGGLNPSIYPMDLDSFQTALGLPLQLYAPYFCPSSPYFGEQSHWQSVASDETLPDCEGFAFENVQPSQSRAFYEWFMDKGIQNAGMVSFESDFMNQNYNCVPAFLQNATSAQEWQMGMAGAALAKNVTIQWCYASPTDIMASLDMPAVTNFRVSFDFCYGQSWNIGESSLLVWAMGAAPSKDTLWSTSNNHTSIPGCPWTADHEDSAAELHVVLALMSNGPVGLSDAIGYTNTTLLKRILMKDGTLLKPTKPITAVDSTFLDSGYPSLSQPGSTGQDGGYVYGTAGIGHSWIFVSFLLPQPYEIKRRDFWPQPEPSDDNSEQHMFAHHSFGDGSKCREGQDAVSSGCVQFVFVSDDPSAGVFVAPAAQPDSINPGQLLYAPTVTAVWQPCRKSRWILLGELDKYVSLSPQRFEQVVCRDEGISVIVRGSPGEEVTLSALRPDGRHEGRAATTQYTVVMQHIRFPESRIASVTFKASTSTEIINQVF